MNPARPFCTRALLGSLAVVLLAGVLSLAGAPSIGPSRTQANRAGAASPPTGFVVVVPTSINDTCTTDVTMPLAEWLQSIKADFLFGPVVVLFQPNGCYLVNGSIELRNFRNFTFDGNGSTFEQQNIYAVEYQYTDSTGTCQTPGSSTGTTDHEWGPCYSAGSAYGYGLGNGGQEQAVCNSTDEFLGNFSLPGGGGSPGSVADDDNLGIMWFVEGGCDLTFENATFTQAGSTDNTGDSPDDALFQLNGPQNVVIANDTLVNTHGEAVTTYPEHEKSTHGYVYPPQDIEITGDTFTGSGTYSVALVGVNRMDISDNTFGNIGLAYFDLEIDGNPGCDCNVNITHNTITGRSSNSDLLVSQSSAAVVNLNYSYNTDTATSYGNVVTITPPSAPVTYGWGSSQTTGTSQNFTFDNNSEAAPIAFDHADIYVRNLANVEVAGNHWIPNVTNQPFVDATGDSNVVVALNTFNGSLSSSQPIVTPDSDTHCYDTWTGGNDGLSCSSEWNGVHPTLPTAPQNLPADQPGVAVVVPSNTSTGSGTIALDSVADSYTGVTSLSYQITGGPDGYIDKNIGSATATLYGWVMQWNSSATPDGTYILQAVACSVTACTSSPSLDVTIDN